MKYVYFNCFFFAILFGIFLCAPFHFAFGFRFSLSLLTAVTLLMTLLFLVYFPYQNYSYLVVELGGVKSLEGVKLSCGR